MKYSRPDTSHSIVIWTAGLASLLPHVVFSHSFQQLYFFHDDWELLDGAARSNLWEWLFQPFLGESIIPVFKLLWLGAIHLFGGSYFAMICLLWATHVAICLLLGWLLARFGVPPAGIAFAVLTFGLAWSNIETLGWSMQWCSQLALLVFLVAWHWLLRILEGGRGIAGYALCLLVSALSSSRGILSGMLLALFVLLSPAARKRKTLLCAVSIAPTALVSLAMYFLVVRHGSHSDLTAALSYGAHCFLLNPLYHLLSIPKKTVGMPALLIYGFLKIAVILWAMWKADARLRQLLLVLVALDLAVAAALGVARFHMGIDTTVSSRYQYLSLFSFGPMAGSLVARSRRLIQAAVLLVWIPVLVYPWKRHAPRWAGWRGVEIRDRLATVPDSSRFDPSSLTAGRARELVERYHLH
jgi:hypothetical protein